MFPLSENISAVKDRISKACLRFQVPAKKVRLLAVSKTFSADRIRAAHESGLSEFGENYVQEGVDKIRELSDLRSALTWHFIGPLQSNKTREVAEHFDWMHTIDREKIARRLSDQRPKNLKPLCVCVQVNVSLEQTKSGVAPEDAKALVLAISELPGIEVRGLMAIPEPVDDPQKQSEPFQRLVALAKDIKAALTANKAARFDVLSMGMSADLEAAISQTDADFETLVRVGSAIFGSRAPKG